MAEKPKSDEAREAMAPVGGGDADQQELVFTIRPSTGEIVKIETIGQGGARRELSEEQYASMAACLVPDPTGLGAFQAAGIDPYALMYQGYMAAGIDYEGAYYQGAADYAAAVQASMAESAGYTPEEIAYYQGMADYAASIA